VKFDRVGSPYAIWFYASIYFLCYIPFTGLSKTLSTIHGIPGATLLPIATMVSLVVMVAFLTAMGWWGYATQWKLFGISLPRPTRYTILSGCCTAVILATATLLFTFEGISIVFALLLMRGGVLVIAPIVDAATKRRTRWYSWVGLCLAFFALFIPFSERGGYNITTVSAVTIGAYLVAYFIRLQLMSRLAKSKDNDNTKRYFVEEQLVTAPVTMLILALGALWGEGAFLTQVRDGFTTHFASGLVLETAGIGFFSQLVGIFGTLIFLDARENTFSVPVNRCSSTLSGVVASFFLAWFVGFALPSAYQLGGAAMIVAAILVLSIAPTVERQRAARAARAEAIETAKA